MNPSLFTRDGNRLLKERERKGEMDRDREGGKTEERGRQTKPLQA